MSSAGTGWSLAALAVTALVLSGCAQLNMRQKPLLLEDALNAYGSALRWGHANTANSFLRARDGTPLASDSPFRKDLRVAEYRVSTRTPVTDSEVLVEARLAYMSTTTGTLQQHQDRQLWWYSDDDRRWYLEGAVPPVLLEGSEAPAD